MSSISLKHASKVYSGGAHIGKEHIVGDRVVNDVDLDIADGEFVVIVGPSGSGKTTLLRMIAGLEQITSGELYIDGKLANDLEPRERDVAMVFQTYGLFPHMTVYDNLAFGLKLRKVSPEIIDEKVREAAEMLDLTPYLYRQGKTLSGGQCQRVALGRAIVRRPKIFLLDEPLSNIDARLRVQMRTEITKLHHKLKTTFVYVTHDQTEAMTMGTRVVVMKDGVIQQADTPNELYERPVNLFTACFLGSPQMNIFKAKLGKDRNGVFAAIGDSRIAVPDPLALRIVDGEICGDVLLGVRPEHMRTEPTVGAKFESTLDATVDVVENLGNESILYLNVDGKDDYATARVDAQKRFGQGEKTTLYLDGEHICLFDAYTERSLFAPPEYDRLSAKSEARDGALYLSFAGNDIELPQSVICRITDRAAAIGNVTVGIRPADFRADGNDADIKICGKATLCDDNGGRGDKLVYVAVDGQKDTTVVATLPADMICEIGDAIELYAHIDDIELFGESGARITTDMPVSLNTTQGVVKNIGGKVVYKLRSARGGKAKLAFDGDARGAAGYLGQQSIYILPDGFDADAVAVKNAPRNSILSGTVTHADFYRGGAVLTVKTKGFDEPVTAVLRGYNGGGVGRKIKLAVDPKSIAIGMRYSFSDELKRK